MTRWERDKHDEKEKADNEVKPTMLQTTGHLKGNKGEVKVK